MASTFSQNLRLELIASGEQTGVWGNTTNNNLGDLIEQAVSGATDLNVTSGDITLTALNGVVDQARSAVLSIVGSAGVTRTVTIPNVSKAYTVKNRSDATINLKTASGSEFEIPTLSEAYVYCNGDDVITGRVITDGANAVNSLPDPFNNAALTGVPTAPTASLGTDTTQVATTAFVQDALQAVYPVGSVYINADSATNPSTLLGFGTWAAIGAGRVLVGQDTGDALFDTLGNTGGSKDAKTGIPCTKAPMSHGPAFPKVKGFKYEWANMTEWPTDRPLFFGTCDDDADVSIAGVIKTLTEEKYLSMRQTETDVKGMQVRRERDRLLITEVDSLNPIRWETLSTEKKEAFRAYRQELLDVPQQQGFPWEVQWPAQP